MIVWLLNTGVSRVMSTETHGLGMKHFYSNRIHEDPAYLSLKDPG